MTTAEMGPMKPVAVSIHCMLCSSICGLKGVVLKSDTEREICNSTAMQWLELWIRNFSLIISSVHSAV